MLLFSPVIILPIPALVAYHALDAAQTLLRSSHFRVQTDGVYVKEGGRHDLAHIARVEVESVFLRSKCSILYAVLHDGSDIVLATASAPGELEEARRTLARLVASAHAP